MKLASLKTGGADGTLIVVSSDLSKAVKVDGIAHTLQGALERWDAVHSHLQHMYDALNDNTQLDDVFAFKAEDCAAPLPRSYQWLDGSAYVNHVELVRKSRGVEMPDTFWSDPLMYQGASDKLMGPCDDIVLPDEAHGIDFEAEIAVVTDEVPMGISHEDAHQHIRLVMLVNDVSLRALAMGELKKGFGFVQSKPATAFSPVAVTPEGLGSAWKDGKVHLPLMTHHNGTLFGKPNAGVDMVFDFAKLVSHAAKTRFLSAGTIIGSGTVSNKDRSAGSSCIVEQRTLEKLDGKEPSTPFMKFGDRVRIEMLDANGKSVFGAIDQKLVQYRAASSKAA